MVSTADFSDLVESSTSDVKNHHNDETDNNDDNDETGCSLVFIGHHTMVHGEAL